LRLSQESARNASPCRSMLQRVQRRLACAPLVSRAQVRRSQRTALYERLAAKWHAPATPIAIADANSKHVVLHASHPARRSQGRERSRIRLELEITP